MLVVQKNVLFHIFLEREDMVSNAAKKWDEAVAAIKGKGEAPTYVEEIEDITNFVCGEDWTSALALLNATGKTINVGCTKGAHYAISYSLTGNGFSRSSSGVFEKEGNLISKREDITSEKILDIAMAFRNHQKRPRFAVYIYEELNKIATEHLK